MDAGPAGADNQAGAFVGDLFGAQAGIGDGLFHGHVGPARPITHEAPGALVHMVSRIGFRARMHLALEVQLGIFGCRADAAASRFQRGGDLVGIVAYGGYDTDAGDDDTSH